MKNSKLAGIGAAFGSMGLFVSKCFATPTYTIDTGVQTGISTLLTDFISGAFSIIVVAIGLVGGYYVTVKLVHVLLRWFHKFA